MLKKISLLAILVLTLHGCSKCSSVETETTPADLPPPVELATPLPSPTPESPEIGPGAAPDFEEVDEMPAE